MENPRFIDQYNKIVRAYLRDELRPMDPPSCFVGNLLNGNGDWIFFRRIWGEYSERGIDCLMEANRFYTAMEILDLEKIFMHCREEDSIFTLNPEQIKKTPDYEDRLYNAMERALVALRQLHESKGEVIEDYEFTRRDLAVAI